MAKFPGDTATEIAVVEAELACSSAAYEEGKERRSRINSAAYAP
jgi:hypothetical protein